MWHLPLLAYVLSESELPTKSKIPEKIQKLIMDLNGQKNKARSKVFLKGCSRWSKLLSGKTPKDLPTLRSLNIVKSTIFQH